MTPAPDLILYVDAFYISPYAFSAFVALREKDLRFETRFVPLQDKAHGRSRPRAVPQLRSSCV